MEAFRPKIVLAVLILCFSCAYSESDQQPFNSTVVGKQCIATLDLPSGYDRHKPFGNMSDGPLEMYFEIDIREFREVDETKKSYSLEVFFWIYWRDERLIGQTERTNCSPVIPDHVTPEFWIPGNLLPLRHRASLHISIFYRC